MTWMMPVSRTRTTAVATMRVMKVAPESRTDPGTRGGTVAAPERVDLNTRLQAELGSDVVDEVQAEHLEGAADGDDRNRRHRRPAQYLDGRGAGVAVALAGAGGDAVGVAVGGKHGDSL